MAKIIIDDKFIKELDEMHLTLGRCIHDEKNPKMNYYYRGIQDALSQVRSKLDKKIGIYPWEWF